jgi:hypothetical protein
MQRFLATLAFAAAFDILFLDGKYVTAVNQVALTYFRGF